MSELFLFERDKCGRVYEVKCKVVDSTRGKLINWCHCCDRVQESWYC